MHWTVCSVRTQLWGLVYSCCYALRNGMWKKFGVAREGVLLLLYAYGVVFAGGRGLLRSTLR